MSATATRACAAALLVLAAGSATAMAVRGGSAPPPPRGNGQAPAGPAAANAPTLTLIDGVVGAVDVAAGTCTIGGRQVGLHGQRLRVFDAAGVPVGAASLRAGSRVRFALEPGEGEGRKIVLVYLQGSP